LSAFEFGPLITDNGVEFRLWAPLQPQVKLIIGSGEPLAMHRDADGWHRLHVGDAKAGALYKFVMPDGLEVPDPGSRFQPEDVHGPSEVIAPNAFSWEHTGWTGRPWEQTILYELHIGAFTAEGTFRAAMRQLDHLKELGITAIQVMPVSDFPGRWGWGYDGVLPYAPESSYGRPEDFMAFIDAAHRRGISVFLDVVYNHFGPDGNYFAAYAPLFTDRHRTPWGAGINYDDAGSRPVREFVIQNALYWITEFRIDGLRLDAVHAIKDDSDEHLLHELARRVRGLAGNRHIHLIVENENNDSSLLQRNADGGSGSFTAQWNDDVHHVLHIAATGERFAYYGDYEAGPHSIGRALAEGFVFQGEHMPYSGERRGTPSAHLPPTAFVSFIQNHDQIGNRALGDRMAASRPPEVLKALAAVYILAPQIPMLFMGEEWGAEEPFPYFCDFNAELNEKVREGRRKELSRLPGFDKANAFDPTSEATFQAAKLLRRVADRESHMLEFYRELLATRSAEIVPRLAGLQGNSGRAFSAPHVDVEWRLGDSSRLRLRANLSSQSVPNRSAPFGNLLFELGDTARKFLGPWAVQLWLDNAGRARIPARDFSSPL
jgi:malto-oligosyltrehalose trehalohydrolase